MRSLILCLWLAWVAAASAVAAPTVVIVSSERGAAYTEAQQALIGELTRGGLPAQEILQMTVPELQAVAALVPKVFVALGSEAALALASVELRAPVLCTLLPRARFEQALTRTGRKASARFSALYLDQPWSRQLNLIRLALPAARRIGVLWGAESMPNATELAPLVLASGLELMGVSVGPDEMVYAPLKRVLEESDVLLALPDPQIYNGSSIQNILLASFRAKVPMVAFSPAYVRAGALLSVHVTPVQMGLQAAAMARSVLQGKALPATPVHSQDFEVSVNEHVARSLALVLDAQALRDRLRRREGAP